MRQCFFAVDLGATSGRTMLASLTDKGMELEEVNRFPNHLIQMQGHFYWDIYELFRHIIAGLKLAARKEDVEICSIGIDTWGVDFVCIGADGLILRQPYAYRDPHTEGAPELFFQRMDRSETYAITGIQVMNFNTLFQIDTLRRRRDSALQAASKLLFTPDALSYLLTGEAVTEYTIASTSQLMDARTRRLSPKLLAALGLDESRFGRLVYPGETIGTLTDEIQRQTGLGAVPVIAVAGHDTASAVAAVPTVTNRYAYLSSGTWSLMGIESPTPVLTPEAERLNFTNEGGVGQTIRLLKNICGMWLLERCRSEWGNPDYGKLMADAQAAPPFRSLIQPDAACFANPPSMEEAIRGFCRQSGQPVPGSAGEVTRCIFESLALRYRRVLEHLQRLSSHPIDVLHVIGGGSRNDLLNQWTANALNLPVLAGPSEATALGNASIQAIAAGKVRDIAALRSLLHDTLAPKRYEPTAHTCWAEAYQRFLTYESFISQ
ncbi:MAG: rhamnulokinase family protein [Bacteroides sp.]